MSFFWASISFFKLIFSLSYSVFFSSCAFLSSSCSCLWRSYSWIFLFVMETSLLAFKPDSEMLVLSFLYLSSNSLFSSSASCLIYITISLYSFLLLSISFWILSLWVFYSYSSSRFFSSNALIDAFYYCIVLSLFLLFLVVSISSKCLAFSNFSTSSITFF